MENDKFQKKRFKEVESLVEQLNSKLENSSIDMIDFDRNRISITFLKDCFLNIMSMDSLRKTSLDDSKQKIVYDKDFVQLKKYLNDEKMGSEYYWFQKVLDLLSSKINKDSYWKLPTGRMKYHFCSLYESETHPNKEFFLYSNDEFKWRYNRNRPELIVPEEGIEIVLNCVHSFVFKNIKTGKRHIDCELSNWTGYFTNRNTVILSRDKIKLVEEGYKKVFQLREGIKEEDCEEYSYENLYKEKLVLKKKNGIFYLEDEKGSIRISHPDLMAYIYDKN